MNLVPRRIPLFLFLAALFCALNMSAAMAAKRIALVIGNSSYQNTSSLKNPANDADLMEQTLKKAGFKVTKILDADYLTMKKAMLDFGRSLKQGPEAGLFYYAGHGVQVDGENFLIPVNARIDDEDEVDLESIPVNSFLRVMNSSTSNINIVVLDACRNNPFARSFRSASRGLAPVDAPRGTYIAYATAPGDVAADGRGKNSPYTLALTRAIGKRGITIEKVFKTAREEVLRETANQQTPWETTSITGDFYFLRQAEIARKSIENDKPVQPQQIISNEAERAFNLIRESESEFLLNAFVRKFPDSFYATIVTARLQDLKKRKIEVEKKKQEAISNPGENKRLSRLKEAEGKWALLKSSTDLNALRKFASEFGDTAFASVAESRIDLLGEHALLKERNKQSTKNEQEILINGRKAIAANRWESLKISTSIVALNKFAREFPDLEYAKLAKNRVERLRAAIDFQRKNGLTSNFKPKKPTQENVSRFERDAKRQWAGLRNSVSEQKLNSFISKYGSTSYAGLARNRLSFLSTRLGKAEIKWRQMEFSASKSELRDFIRQYSGTTQAFRAKRRIELLDKREAKTLERQADRSFDKKQFKTAFRQYRQSVAKGNVDAAARLAFMYQTGSGTKKNHRETVRLYEMYMEKYPKAEIVMGNLAVNYDEGKGVRQDTKKAASLLYDSIKLGSSFYLDLMTNRTKANNWNKQTRRELQRLLKRNGFYSGSIDGSFGPGTAAALRKLAGK